MAEKMTASAGSEPPDLMKLKTIAYIEIDTHAEIAQNFMEVMQGSGKFTVDYYFSEKIRNQIVAGQENVFLSDSSMIVDQLKDKKYDLILIGTVHRYFNTFYAIADKYNTGIIVHNLNFSNISRSVLIKNIFKEDIIYRLKLWWKEGLFYAAKVYQKAGNLLVLDERMSSEKYRFLPLFYTRDFQDPGHEGFTVIIPGGVSQKRRDYRHVFKTIRGMETSENCTFVFLGNAKGDELKQLEEISANLPENIRIKYFRERVSSVEFDYWMRTADVLWCPIRPETEFFSQKEIYGVTKITGNLGDAIKYGKIAVFPESYPSHSDFIIPEKADVIEQLKDLKSRKFDFHKNYNREKVRKNLERVLDSMIPI